MMRAKRSRMIKYKQKKLNQMFAHLFVMNACIVLMILVSVTVRTSRNNQIEGEIITSVHESNNTIVFDNHDTVNPPANVLPSNGFTTLDNTSYPIETLTVKYDRGLSDNEKYLLAKLIMTEAEGESLETKVCIAWVVLNRVYSSERFFPDTIEEVIFQKSNGVYQFSPVAPGGRWWKVEPNEECWEAVRIVNETNYDFSEGALYFEACQGDSWHSRNLEFICQIDNTRFYK